MTPDPRQPHVEPPTVIVKWEVAVGDLLDRTLRFPKASRFTFARRIDDLALDIMERLVVARYARGPKAADALEDADLALARLRVIIRLSHARGLLDHRGYAHVSRNLDETGRMLGGWRAWHADR